MRKIALRSRFVAFQQSDAGFFVAVCVVVFLDLRLIFLDGEWIQRIARLQPGLFWPLPFETLPLPTNFTSINMGRSKTS